MKTTFLFLASFIGLIAAVGYGADEYRPDLSRTWKTAQQLFGASTCVGPEIVYDSNVSGNFDIYRQCAAPGSTATAIVDEPEWHEIYPDPSPDGSKLVYAKAKQPFRDSPAEIWLRDLKSGATEQITPSGTFPSFSGDGESVFYERNQTAVFRYDLATKKETQIFPWPGSGFEGRFNAKPRVSRDGVWLYYTTDRPARWNAWRVNLKTGAPERIGHGCQPAPYAQDAAPVWIAKRRDGRGSDIYRYDAATKKSEILQAATADTFAYFPEVSADGRYLVYGACRCHPKQRSHETGNYEIMLVTLSDKTQTAVTANGATNRWPKILPSHE